MSFGQNLQFLRKMHKGMTQEELAEKMGVSTPLEAITQVPQQYAVITIKNPFKAPFSLIPNAYKTLMRYMEVNNFKHKQTKEDIPCFEKIYDRDDVQHMDVYIAIA